MLHAEMQLVTFWGGGGEEKSKENAKMYFKTFYAIAFHVAPISLSPFEHKPVDVAINLILKVWLVVFLHAVWAESPGSKENAQMKNRTLSEKTETFSWLSDKLKKVPKFIIRHRFSLAFDRILINRKIKLYDCSLPICIGNLLWKLPKKEASQEIGKSSPEKKFRLHFSDISRFVHCSVAVWIEAS